MKQPALFSVYPWLYGCASLLLAACTASRPGLDAEEADSAPETRVEIASIPDAVPRVEPRSRYGNPRSYVVRGKRYHTMKHARGYTERGIGSWYGTKFHGRRTSSGEPYDMYAMTAAHKSLPLPTYVRVTNLRNNRSVVVKVNDRGPFHANRIIDMSYAAAAKLGMLSEGTALVGIEALDPRAPQPPPAPETPAAVEPAQIFIQVGAFSASYNADRLRERLARHRIINIQVEPGETQERKVYRVRVGPIASVEEADQLANQLTALGIDSMHVVIE